MLFTTTDSGTSALPYETYSNEEERVIVRTERLLMDYRQPYNILSASIKVTRLHFSGLFLTMNNGKVHSGEKY